MNTPIKTFKPHDNYIASLVDYYYIDHRPQNQYLEIDCFPHYNSTISIYRSQYRDQNGVMNYDGAAGYFQIFTPIHDNVLQVKQRGPVHRIVIVLRPLAIYNFYSNLSFNKYIYGYQFFSTEELDQIFSMSSPHAIASALDSFLMGRITGFHQPALHSAIQNIIYGEAGVPVNLIAVKVQHSRQHLNRLFQQYLGISIKRFQQIVRFRKAIQKKLSNGTLQNLTMLAYAHGYVDQSHFIKEFKQLTNYPPKTFFKKGDYLGAEDTFWHIKR